MSDTTRPDLDDDSGFPVLTEEQLDEMLADPCIAYDSVAMEKLLDEIGRLQSDEPVSDEDAAFERDLSARYPAWSAWPLRERERAIRAGLIPDEPVDDEDDEELLYDDLAS